MALQVAAMRSAQQYTAARRVNREGAAEASDARTRDHMPRGSMHLLLALDLWG